MPTTGAASPRWACRHQRPYATATAAMYTDLWISVPAGIAFDAMRASFDSRVPAPGVEPGTFGLQNRCSTN